MKTEKNIKVWDILIRIFHWSLVVFFFIAYLTGEGGWWHIYSGYIVLALIIFRVIWGMIGTKYALFSSFVYSRTMTMITNTNTINTEKVEIFGKTYMKHPQISHCFLVFLHIFGVIVFSKISKENLIESMIIGNKKITIFEY